MEVILMTPSTHDEYLSHLTSQLIIQAENPLFWQQISTYGDTLASLLDISLDPVGKALADLYCPTNSPGDQSPVSKPKQAKASSKPMGRSLQRP